MWHRNRHSQEDGEEPDEHVQYVAVFQYWAVFVDAPDRSVLLLTQFCRSSMASQLQLDT
jgi:hypothetical protein